MENTQFICHKCCMDRTDPDISFNSSGICNHCQTHQQKEQERQAELTNLPWIYHSIKESGKNKKYDCLIGLSGGVDSSMALHYLVENGLRPLTFSVNNGWNTRESEENIMRLVEGLKLPFYCLVLNKGVFWQLQAAFIESGTANIEIPTDHVLMAASYQMAIDNDIKFIVSGGNWATESIMPPAWGYQARDLRYIKQIYKKFTKRKLVGLPTISLPQYVKYRFCQGIKVVNLLDYYEYNRMEAKKLLSGKYGWKDYGLKHEESIFTAWFQNCYLIKKFGIDKRKAHYSSLINSGQMTRAEALQLLKEPPVYPDLKFDFMKYPKRSYQDYPNNEWLWKLLSKGYALFKRGN